MLVSGLGLIWSFGEKRVNCSSDRSGIWFKDRLCVVVCKVPCSPVGILCVAGSSQQFGTLTLMIVLLIMYRGKFSDERMGSFIICPIKCSRVSVVQRSDCLKLAPDSCSKGQGFSGRVSQAAQGTFHPSRVCNSD